MQDMVGGEIWDEWIIFKLACRLTLFANDKIRVVNFMPMEPNGAQATFYNTNLEYAATVGGKTYIEDSMKTIATFNSSSTYTQSFQVDFGEELNGLDTFNYGFHRADGKDLTKWNGWNFTDPHEWNVWWYHLNTTVIFETTTFTIGKTQLEVIGLELIPEQEIFNDKKVESSLFGIPLSYSDVVEQRVFVKIP